MQNSKKIANWSIVPSIVLDREGGLTSPAASYSRICPKCGAANSPTSSTCCKCGAPLGLPPIAFMPGETWE